MARLHRLIDEFEFSGENLDQEVAASAAWLQVSTGVVLVGDQVKDRVHVARLSKDFAKGLRSFCATHGSSSLGAWRGARQD